MSRWFRFYDEVVNDPKVQRLSGDKFKTWVNLLCLASGNGGILPSVSDMSFALRISEQKLGTIIQEFCEMQLIDKIEPSGFAPHNWNGRQFKSDVSNDRVKRFRERKRNVTPSNGNAPSTVTETPPESDTESDSVSSKKKKLTPDGVGQVEKGSNPDPPVTDQQTADAQLFARGREVLGNVKGVGGLITELKKHFNGNIALARAAIETASTKDKPREYIGAIVRGKREHEADKSHLIAGLWDPGI
jgi:hypothetical protein